MTVTTTDAPTARLGRQDRCDRCGARAYVRATLAAAGGADLLFCGHHYRAHEAKLAGAGAEILDERHLIDA